MAFTGLITVDANALVVSGTTAWSLPNNLHADDGAFTDIEGDSSVDPSDSNKREWTASGLSVPAGATILGIEVRIEGLNADVQLNDLRMQPTVSSSLVGDVTTITGDEAGSPFDTTFGGATDTLNSGVTAADINAGDFGIALWHFLHGAQGTASWALDVMQIGVYYEVASAAKRTGLGLGLGLGL